MQYFVCQDEFRMDLTGLQGDAEYEVRIRAMNHQGWSQLSDPFLFKTSGRQIDRQLHSYIDREIDAQIDKKLDRQDQGWIQLSEPFLFKTSGRQIDRCIARWLDIERKKDRYIGRQINVCIDRQIAYRWIENFKFIFQFMVKL